MSKYIHFESKPNRPKQNKECPNTVSNMQIVKNKAIKKPDRKRK